MVQVAMDLLANLGQFEMDIMTQHKHRWPYNLLFSKMRSTDL